MRTVEYLVENEAILYPRLESLGAALQGGMEQVFRRHKVTGCVAREGSALSFYLMRDVPAETDESEAMSRALKKSGFRFVGPTICYAFMQAVGMVNDHLTTCFRHAELAEPRRRAR